MTEVVEASEIRRSTTSTSQLDHLRRSWCLLHAASSPPRRPGCRTQPAPRARVATEEGRRGIAAQALRRDLVYWIPCAWVMKPSAIRPRPEITIRATPVTPQ